MTWPLQAGKNRLQEVRRGADRDGHVKYVLSAPFKIRALPPRVCSLFVPDHSIIRKQNALKIRRPPHDPSGHSKPAVGPAGAAAPTRERSGGVLRTRLAHRRKTKQGFTASKQGVYSKEQGAYSIELGADSKEQGVYATKKDRRQPFFPEQRGGRYKRSKTPVRNDRRASSAQRLKARVHAKNHSSLMRRQI